MHTLIATTHCDNIACIFCDAYNKHNVVEQKLEGDTENERPLH